MCCISYWEHKISPLNATINCNGLSGQSLQWYTPLSMWEQRFHVIMCSKMTMNYGEPVSAPCGGWSGVTGENSYISHWLTLAFLTDHASSSAVLDLQEIVQVARGSMEHAQCTSTAAASRANLCALRWLLCVDTWWAWISSVGISFTPCFPFSYL